MVSVKILLLFALLGLASEASANGYHIAAGHPHYLPRSHIPGAFNRHDGSHHLPPGVGRSERVHTTHVKTIHEPGHTHRRVTVQETKGHRKGFGAALRSPLDHPSHHGHPHHAHAGPGHHHHHHHVSHDVHHRSLLH